MIEISEDIFEELKQLIDYALKHNDWSSVEEASDLIKEIEDNND
jgi:hypothetical protein